MTTMGDDGATGEPADGAAEAATGAASETATEAAILALVADFLDVAPAELQPWKTLDDLGIDSLTLTEIMFEVEERFDAPVIAEMQRRRDGIADLGGVLRLAAETIARCGRSVDDG